jgi:transcriptional regulator with XRE-family HTH domain
MKARKLALPEWARRILGLRRRMGLSQAELAARINYSAMALSRWERGTHEPPAQAYIQLGKLADEPTRCLWFWGRAGLSRADLTRIVAHLEENNPEKIAAD